MASFESSLEELEKVVKELESGDLPLDRSLAASHATSNQGWFSSS